MNNDSVLIIFGLCFTVFGLFVVLIESVTRVPFKNSVLEKFPHAADCNNQQLSEEELVCSDQKKDNLVTITYLHCAGCGVNVRYEEPSTFHGNYYGGGFGW